MGKNDNSNKALRFSPSTANFSKDVNILNKMLSYRRETALQGALILAKSGRLELGDNNLQTI